MDFDKVLYLIREMNREAVDYITFGAVELNLHGIVRATTDADFFIKPDRDNIERLKRALRNVWNDPHIDKSRRMICLASTLRSTTASRRKFRYRLAHTTW